MNAMIWPGFAAIVGYLVGSIPFSYIAGKAVAGIDLREHGSGNLGATNTLRFVGAKVAALVLVADVLKGFLPAYLAPAYTPAHGVADHWLMIGAALGAVLGHMFSVYLKFSGGKGIATSAGAFLALAPAAVLGSFVVWVAAFGLTRIVSVASMAGALALPLGVYLCNRLELVESHQSIFWIACVVSFVVIVKHRSNIERLVAGREPVMGKGKHSS